MKLRLKDIRLERGLTQRDVADRAGISLSYYTEIELGKKRVNSQRIPAIAKALGVRVADLFDETDDPMLSELRIAFSALTPSERETVINVARSLREAGRK